MNGQSCGTCRYFDDYHTEHGVDYGWCRRYPPALPGDDTDYTQYPTTLGHSWCGEYCPANPGTISEGATYLARLVVIGDVTAAYALVDKLQEERPNNGNEDSK